MAGWTPNVLIRVELIVTIDGNVFSRRLWWRSVGPIQAADVWHVRLVTPDVIRVIVLDHDELDE